MKQPIKPEEKSIFKKEIPKKYIYLGYGIIIIVGLIVASLYFAKVSASLQSNNCVNKGGTWDTKTSRCIQ